MDGRALRLGSVYGIDIRVHRSWIVIALLVTWSFSSRYATVGEHALGPAIAMGIVGAALFFLSVLVHEVAHSLEAEHRGVEVGGITLFLFGGATETRGDVERPGDEFALTAVGPFSSLVLAGAFGVAATYAGRAGLPAVAQVAGTLGWINLALAVFNLLPGAPLDGGRILRSLVWKATGDRGRAVRVASRAGQVIGYGIAALGILQLFTVPGAVLGGVWWILIGWFLANAAGSELVQHELQGRLEGVTLADLVTDEPVPTVPHDASVATVADELRRRPESVLALARDGEDVALVGVEDVAAVRERDREGRPAMDIARRLDDVPTRPAGTPLLDVVRDLGSSELVGVTGPGDGIVGVVTLEQLRRVVERSLRMDGPTRSSRHRPEDHLPAPGRRRRRATGSRDHVPEGDHA